MNPFKELIPVVFPSPGLLIILLTLFSAQVRAQDNPPSKEKLLEAMNNGAMYAMTSLLDQEGKSRCDYNIIEGKWYPYEEPWHTAQIINALVEVHRLTGDKRYRDAARRAGDWWVGLEIKDHPKLKGMVRAIHGDGIDKIVFATVSDGTPGLFNLYRLTGEKKYAEVPTRAGEWMLQHMYIPNEGMFYDMVDPVTGDVLKENSLFWPEKTQQSLNDVARPNNEGSLYKDMYEYTKNPKYKEVFLNLCNCLVRTQGPEGLWMQFSPNDEAGGKIHPRFNLWNAESLIEGYLLTGEKKYLEAAKKTCAYFVKLQQKDGTIFYDNFLNGRFRENSFTGSAVSFAALLWIRLVDLGVGEEFKPSIEKSIHWVLASQFSPNHPDKNLAGGFLDSRTRSKSGRIWLTQRDVGTPFALRFLVAYYNYTYKGQ
jgi:uncharacterized protein YyaL (SSP411 family)